MRLSHYVQTVRVGAPLIPLQIAWWDPRLRIVEMESTSGYAPYKQYKVVATTRIVAPADRDILLGIYAAPYFNKRIPESIAHHVYTLAYGSLYLDGSPLRVLGIVGDHEDKAEGNMAEGNGRPLESETAPKTAASEGDRAPSNVPIVSFCNSTLGSSTPPKTYMRDLSPKVYLENHLDVEKQDIPPAWTSNASHLPKIPGLFLCAGETLELNEEVLWKYRFVAPLLKC